MLHNQPPPELAGLKPQSSLTISQFLSVRTLGESQRGSSGPGGGRVCFQGGTSTWRVSWVLSGWRVSSRHCPFAIVHSHTCLWSVLPLHSCSLASDNPVLAQSCPGAGLTKADSALLGPQAEPVPALLHPRPLSSTWLPAGSPSL